MTAKRVKKHGVKWLVLMLIVGLVIVGALGVYKVVFGASLGVRSVARSVLSAVRSVPQSNQVRQFSQGKYTNILFILNYVNMGVFLFYFFRGIVSGSIINQNNLIITIIHINY